MIDIPEPGSSDELEFEKRFEDALGKKTLTSIYREGSKQE